MQPVNGTVTPDKVEVHLEGENPIELCGNEAVGIMKGNGSRYGRFEKLRLPSTSLEGDVVPGFSLDDVSLVDPRLVDEVESIGVRIANCSHIRRGN